MLRITFDSNVWEALVLPDRRATHADRASLERIFDEIESGRILPLISDVIVVIESTPRRGRQVYFRSSRTQATYSELGDTTNVEIEMIRPDVPRSPQLEAALAAAIKAGFRFIRVGRVSQARLEEHRYLDAILSDDDAKQVRIA